MTINVKDSARISALLELIFGSKVKDADCSEESLIKLIELKKQQEITKQNYYKLEISNASISLLKLAINYKIPPSQIASIFGHVDSSDVGYGNILKSRDINFSDTRKQDSISEIKIKTEQPSNQPLSYTFPPQTSRSNNTPSNLIKKPKHKRTHSPARIGANAVALLNDSIIIKEEESTLQIPSFSTLKNNVANFNNTSKSDMARSHKRNMSLPVNSSSYYNMTNVLNFTTDKYSVVQNSNSHVFVNQNNLKFDSSNNFNSGKYAQSPSLSHKRASSSTSFKVVDLNQISEQTNTFKRQLGSNNSEVINLSNISKNNTTMDNLDDLTYSEASSCSHSPVRSTNSKQIIKENVNIT